MSINLSENVQKVAPSMTLAISAIAKKKIADGEDVINFSVGEPDFDTPDAIKEAAIQALNSGKTKYTAVSGIVELKEAIANKYKSENKVNYSADDVIVSSGGKQAIFNALMAILNPGDKVLIPVPYWTSYPEMVTLAYGTPVLVQPSDSTIYKVSVNDLDRYYSPEVKCLIINSPSNPSGVVYESEELREIATWAVKKNVILLSDEIYEKLSYDSDFTSIASLSEEIRDQTITINGFSKTYAMTGLRLGYSISSNKQITKLINTIQSHTTSNANSITQYAGLEALSTNVDFMIDTFKRRRDLIIAEAKKIDQLKYIYPQGAFYLLIDISPYIGKFYGDSKISDSLDFAQIFLEKEKVALTPGSAFGMDSYIRISYALSDEKLVEGMQRLKNFVNAIK